MSGKRTRNRAGRPKKSTRAPSNLNRFNTQRTQRRQNETGTNNNSSFGSPSHQNSEEQHASLLHARIFEQQQPKGDEQRTRDETGKWVSFETALTPLSSRRTKRTRIGRKELRAVSGRLFESESPDKLLETREVKDEMLEGNRLIPFQDLKDKIEDQLLCMNCSRRNSLSTLDSLFNDISTEFCEGDVRKEKRLKEIFRKYEWKLRKFTTNITLEEKTVGLATEVKCRCKTCDDNLVFSTKCQRTKFLTHTSQTTTESFLLNCTFVLALQLLGGGGIDAEILFGFLNIPNAPSMRSKKFHRIEQKLSPIICSIADDEVNSALDEEVYLQLKTEGREGDFVRWKEKNLGYKPELTVSYDMGWQQRSSGRKYDSDSGHGLMIGMHSRKIIGFKIKSKQCRICKVAAKKKIPAPKHICSRNHVKSSKAMEVDVILELCVEYFDKKGVSIAYIVSDDDTTMRSNLKHSLREKIDAGYMYLEDWPRTNSGRKKNCHGRLPLRVPEPLFLADPSHRKKTLGKNLYALASLPSSKSLVTKELAQKLMISYGYMLYQIRKMKWETDRDEIMRKVQAPLEHRFGNHCYCSDTWCRFLKAEKDGKTYTPPAGSFYCKVADKPLYDELKPIFDRFTSAKVIVESVHNMSTQKNESMNNVIARLCPKLKHVSESITLLTRVCLAVAYSNLGFTSLFTKILEKLGVDRSSLNDPATRILTKTLKRIDNIKVNEAIRKKTQKYRAQRKYGDKAKRKEQIYLERISDGTYQTGIAMSDQPYAPTSSEPDKIQTPRVKESQQSFITQDQTENKTPCPWVIESQQSLNTQDMNKIPSNSVAIDNVNVTAKLPPYNIASPSSPVPRNYFLKPANEEMSRKKNDSVGTPSTPGPQHYIPKPVHEKTSRITDTSDEMNENNEKIECKKKSTHVDPVCKSESTYKYDSDHSPTMSKSKG